MGQTRTLICLLILAAAALGFCVIGVNVFRGGLARWRRARLLALAPTPVGDVPTGSGEVVKVRGRVSCEHAIASAVSGEPCVYSQAMEQGLFRVSTRRHNIPRTTHSWSTLEETRRQEPFSIEDPTGSIRVVPKDAEILTDDLRTIDLEDELIPSPTTLDSMRAEFSGNRRLPGRRLVERRIPLGEEVSVIGVVSSKRGKRSMKNRADCRLTILNVDESSLAFKERFGAAMMMIAGLSAVVVIVIPVVFFLGFSLGWW